MAKSVKKKSKIVSKGKIFKIRNKEYLVTRKKNVVSVTLDGDIIFTSTPEVTFKMWLQKTRME